MMSRDEHTVRVHLRGEHGVGCIELATLLHSAFGGEPRIAAEAHHGQVRLPNLTESLAQLPGVFDLEYRVSAIVQVQEDVPPARTSLLGQEHPQTQPPQPPGQLHVRLVEADKQDRPQWCDPERHGSDPRGPLRNRHARRASRTVHHGLVEACLEKPVGAEQVNRPLQLLTGPFHSQRCLQASPPVLQRLPLMGAQEAHQPVGVRVVKLQ